MNILFVSRSFDNMAGGLERMAIALMNEMIRRGHHVSLLTWDKAGAQSYYPIDDRAQWLRLDCGNHEVRSNVVTRFKRMLLTRKFIRETKPDVILAFQQGAFLAMRLYALGMGIPIIAAERNSPRILDFTTSGKKRTFIYRSLFFADCITIQVPFYKRYYPNFLHRKIVCIPNPVFEISAPSREETLSDFPRKRILSVGRLSFQKNYPVLIEVFARCARDYPEWDLVIAGEGEQRSALEKKIRDLKLKDRVFLLGAVKDVPALLGTADVFCMTSLWEGFPNALGEALSAGLPAIGFAGCDGVNHLILDGVNGLLAAGNDNPESLYQVVLEMISDDVKRLQLASKAKESVAAYHPESIFNRWEELFQKMCRRSASDASRRLVQTKG